MTRKLMDFTNEMQRLIAASSITQLLRKDLDEQPSEPAKMPAQATPTPEHDKADATSPPLPAATGGRPPRADKQQIEAMIDVYLANPGVRKQESFFSNVEAWCEQREEKPPHRRTLERWLAARKKLQLSSK
jgi:hypothetical protein